MVTGGKFENTYPIMWYLELETKTIRCVNYLGSPESYLRGQSFNIPSLDILMSTFESFAYTTQLRRDVITYAYGGPATIFYSHVNYDDVWSMDFYGHKYLFGWYHLLALVKYY